MRERQNERPNSSLLICVEEVEGRVAVEETRTCANVPKNAEMCVDLSWPVAVAVVASQS